MQVQRLSLETAKQQVGEHVDTWFVQLRQKQGRGHPWRRRVWTSPLVRRSAKSFMQGSSSGSLRSFRPVIWFLFPHPTYPGTLPWVCMHPSAKMDLKVKVWEEQDSLCLSLSLDLRPPRSLSVRVQCLPCPKREGSRDPLILYSNRILPLSILAMTLNFDYRHDYKRKTLAIYPGSVVTSDLEGKQEADYKCFTWSSPNS